MAAYCIWGVAPIYFKLVGHVQPLEIIAHRVTWSAILLMAVLAFSGKLGELLLEGFEAAVVVKVVWVYVGDQGNRGVVVQERTV